MVSRYCNWQECNSKDMKQNNLFRIHKPTLLKKILSSDINFLTTFIHNDNWKVVAQLAKATGRQQTEDAAVPGSNPAPPQSPERGQDIWLCII
jgi:hypothetical protein